MISAEPKILYFLEDMVPTVEEQIEIDSLNFKPQIRNGRISAEEGEVEKCDGVLGSVPKQYNDKPDGDAVIAQFRKARVDRLKNQRAGLNEEKPERKKRGGAAKPFQPGADDEKKG